MTDVRGYTIFCDDIRVEVGGKRTLVGVYRSEMILHAELPVRLPKLGVAIYVQAPIENPLKELKLKIYMPGDAEDAPTISGEIKLPEKQISSRHREEEADHWIVFCNEVLLSPVDIKQEGLIRVRAEVEGELVRMGTLRVRSGETTPPSQPESASAKGRTRARGRQALQH